MYEKILVPTDGSEGAQHALEEALELARRFDAVVHSLSIVDTTAVPPDTDYAGAFDSFEGIAERTTDDAVARVEEAGVEAVGAVRAGTPHRSILDYADENDIDLVVMGTHGRTGIQRYLLGSVTEKVVRTADVPVLTVRAPEDE